MKHVLDISKYRVHGGAFSLDSINPSDTAGLKKAAAKERRKANKIALDELQERLYAEEKQSLLVVLQAMDAGGKDSTIETVMSGLNPQGCVVTSFKAPSTLERSHDFLWRIHERAPRKGYIGIFNRSHYEDVLIVRVKGWAPPALIEKRYTHINDFERLLHDHGTRIVKIMLHISPEYQLSRFKERLMNSEKYWKFNPDDLKERKLWSDYMEAFELALNRCSTDYAPWYVVPSEHKWFRTLLVSEIIRQALEEMNPQYPEPEYDPSQYPPDSLT